jgi:mono/diheme cytochrome c family protein
VLPSLSTRRVFAASIAFSVLGIAGVACKKRNFNTVKSSASGKTSHMQKLAQQLPDSHDEWLKEVDRRDSTYRAYFSNPNDMATDWYFHKPLGLNGVPYLALRTLMVQFPDIWMSVSEGDKSRGIPTSFYNRLGFPPRPDDYVNNAIEGWSGELKPEHKRNPLPYGFAMAKDFTNDANSIPGTENVFFSCAACHTGRVAKEGQVRFFPGGSGTQPEAQLFAGLLYQTAMKFVNVQDLASGKVGIGQVKSTTLQHKANTLNFLRLLGTFQCDEKKGLGGSLQLSQYKPHLHDGSATGGVAYQDSIQECKKQKMILFGEGTDLPTSDQLQASLADVTYDDVLMDPKTEGFRSKVSLTRDVVNNFRSENSNFKKLLKNVVGSGVKTAVMYYKVGKPAPYADKLGDATPDFGKFEERVPLAFGEISKSRREKAPPNLFDERPGQMDAFGLVQGIIYLNAARPDHLMFKYFPSQVMPRMAESFGPDYVRDYENTSEYKESLAWVGSAGSDVAAMNESRGTLDGQGRPNFNGKAHAAATTWVSQAAALSDIKSLFRSGEEFHANWDGNEGAGARVLASGLSSVGDPTKVFTEIHETQNPYIMNMPSPMYPFEEVKTPEFFAQAKKGEELYNKACATCHHKRNDGIFNVGTDPNRAHVLYSPFARMALVSLTQAACDWGKQREKLREQNGIPRMDRRQTPTDPKAPYWCEMIPGVDGKPPQAFANYAAQTDDMLRGYRGNASGYKADALYGIWQDAPYFHNGSVPSLRLLLATEAERDAAAKTFIRGNIYYNEKEGGFEYKNHLTVASANAVGLPRHVMQKDDVGHTAVFDTEKRGNSNSGHEFFHDEVEFDPSTYKWVGKGRVWTMEEREAVIQYMKTL